MPRTVKKPLASKDDLVELGRLVSAKATVAAKIRLKKSQGIAGNLVGNSALEDLDNRLLDLSEQIVEIEARVELPAKIKSILRGRNQ